MINPMWKLLLRLMINSLVCAHNCFNYKNYSIATTGIWHVYWIVYMFKNITYMLRQSVFVTRFLTLHYFFLFSQGLALKSYKTYEKVIFRKNIEQTKMLILTVFHLVVVVVILVIN